jgi:hypothetical protein
MRPAGLIFLVGLGVSSSAAGQSLVIEHNGLGCVVAGKYPKLSACIAPRARVARARVYFRGEGTSNWYYVSLTSDMPCYRGLLPKPKRDLQRFSYYIEALDTAFAETQTGEYVAEVVPDEGSCRKGPVAPFLENASVVATPAAGGAAIPTGFLTGAVGGFPVGVVLGVVGGGAAVVGGISGIGGGGTPTSQLPPTTTTAGSPSSTLAGPVPTTNPATSTTTLPGATTTTVPGTPTTTLPGATTTTLPGPPTTTLPGPTTTTFPGPTTTTFPSTTTTTVPGTTTTTLPATTTTTLNPCAGDTTPPSVAITSPTGGLFLPLPVTVSANATSAYGIAKVDFYYQESGPHAAVHFGTSTATPYRATLFSLCQAALLDTFALTAVATDNCGLVNTSSPVTITLLGLPLCFASVAPPPGAGWISDLAVPGGQGQVVLNGTDAFFPSAGPSRVTAPVRPGSNRVEAVLVSANGRGGTWRFDLGGQGLKAGSLRVVAGEVVLATPDTVVFRLSGRPGERVVFAFRTEDQR